MTITTEKIKNLLIVVLVVILIFLGYGYFNQKSITNDQRIESINLTKALSDSIHTFKNKQGEWEVEKRTIQATMNDLSKFNEQLTSSQKELLDRVKKTEKTNAVISAALIDIGVKVTGLTNDKPVSIDSTSVTFKQTTDSISYQLTIADVKPLKAPILIIDSLLFPNKQFISFQWKEGKKEGYPVSFVVSNSNPFFKVSNVDSYIIPEIKKEELKPTFWNKLGGFTKKTSGRIIIFGAGMLVGGILINSAN